MNIKELIFKNLQNVISENEENSESILSILRKYVMGEYDKYELNHIDSVYKVIENRKMRGLTKLVIEFEDDETFLSLMGFDEDDRWFIRRIQSGNYSDYEFMDFNSSFDDFEQGYGVWFSFSEEAMELLKTIHSVLLPGSEFDEPTELEKSDFAKMLIEFAPDEVDDLVEAYVMFKNEEMTNVANDSIFNDIKKEVQKEFFNIYSSYDKVETSVANLIRLYRQFNTKNEPLDEVFRRCFKKNEGHIGGYYENSYEFQDHNFFDSDGFNREIIRILEKIVERIGESEEIEEYIKIVEEIKKKFKFGTWYILPKDNNFRFQIERFSFEEKKIFLTLKNKNSRIKLIKLSFEDLIPFLYQPELFSLESYFN